MRTGGKAALNTRRLRVPFHLACRFHLPDGSGPTRASTFVEATPKKRCRSWIDEFADNSHSHPAFSLGSKNGANIRGSFTTC